MMRLQLGAGALRGAGPVVVVSPHLDDGAMSCGCLIAGLARRRPVSVVTVFAGRPCERACAQWDRAAGFASGCAAVNARRSEDRAALSILGARPHWLSFRDSQYGPSPPAVAIARRLAGIPMLRASNAAVLFPLGLFHSDHRLARDATLMLMRRFTRPAIWLAYEDALYRRLPGLRDAALARLRRAGFAARPARTPSDANAAHRKARAVGCYVSQLRALDTPGRLGHADALEPEGYWMVRLARARADGESGTDRHFVARPARARADRVPCCASCPPADKSDKASASSFTYAQQGTPSARRSTVVAGQRFTPSGVEPRVMGGRRRVGKGGGAGLLVFRAGGHEAATTTRRPRRYPSRASTP